MSNTPADIMMKALDLVGQAVTLYLAGDAEFGGVSVRFGQLTGLDESGQPCLLISNYHDSSGQGVARTIVMASEVIDIKAYHPGA
jgi:hypothetical protein